jgi:N-methylhydantoinase A/oxoprolinase/acetone carboxylase beta subunit
LAEKLGIGTILVPAEAGVLSAFGLHHAVEERFAERQILRPLAECMDLPVWLHELRAAAAWNEGRTMRRALAELRVQGQEATLTVEFAPDGCPSLEELTHGFAPNGCAPKTCFQATAQAAGGGLAA